MTPDTHIIVNAIFIAAILVVLFMASVTMIIVGEIEKLRPDNKGDGQ